jgi:hypothetical protein
MVHVQFTIYCETCQTAIEEMADPHRDVMEQAFLCAMRHGWCAFTSKDEALNCNETQFWCSLHNKDIKKLVQGDKVLKEH